MVSVRLFKPAICIGGEQGNAADSLRFLPGITAQGLCERVICRIIALRQTPTCTPSLRPTRDAFLKYREFIRTGITRRWATNPQIVDGIKIQPQDESEAEIYAVNLQDDKDKFAIGPNESTAGALQFAVGQFIEDADSPVSDTPAELRQLAVDLYVPLRCYVVSQLKDSPASKDPVSLDILARDIDSLFRFGPKWQETILQTLNMIRELRKAL